MDIEPSASKFVQNINDWRLRQDNFLTRHASSDEACDPLEQYGATESFARHVYACIVGQPKRLGYSLALCFP